ncbi:MAG: hypothetical protein K2X02_04400 [Alphaproteobacteria bacterium]|nr:hypothetical protein [Alphaproteobacteria bacterium]
MSPFKINFLKLLKSTAMTLLFVPGVSAMEDDGWGDYHHLMGRPSVPAMEGSFSKEVVFLPYVVDPLTKALTAKEPYLSSRLRVGNTEQYREICIPQAPVIYPYNVGIDFPLFSHAARQNVRELNPSLFPAFSKAQTTLLGLGIDPQAAEYFYVVQNAPWSESRPRMLQPHHWVFPDAPYSSGLPYSKSGKVNVAIFSPNNAITLISPSEGEVICHNFITPENPNGMQQVVSSGPTFPILAGFKEDQTSFFVSTVVIPVAKKAAVTFHTILDDSDFELLQKTEINTLTELQSWLANLFQSKYGATSDSSSEFSGASSSSTLAPADASVLPARTTTFHMGKRDDYQTTGFSAYEGTHRWTEGMEASLTLPFEKMGRRPSRISFLNTRGLITASHPQELTVKVNGKEVGHYVYTAGNNNQTIDIRLPEAGPATIKFEIPTAASPSDLRINADKRVLGISFRDVQFHY